MKKLFIFLIPLFLFFLSPIRVDAKYGSFVFTDLRTYLHGAGGVTNKVNKLKDDIYNGMPMKTFEMASTEVFTGVNYTANLTTPIDNPFDISFQIISPYPEVGIPSVSINQHACEVVGQGFNLDFKSSTDEIYTTAVFRSVVCRNVTTSNSEVLIKVTFPENYSYGNLLVPGSRLLYGITSFYAYTIDDTSSSIKHQTEVIQNQTDAINKQTEEVKKGTEATKENKDAIDKNTEATNKQTETIKDSDVSGASESANSFFGGFDSDDFGLSDIVTMPLEFIKGLSSNTCNSLVLPMPFVEQNVTLPCMTSIYQTYFGAFLTIYQTITTGFIAYWVCVNIFRLVQGFKNPDNDEVEVLDL